jgi:aryl-alcohol dehydrogenase-like predicted oxidoreductase
MNIGIGCMGMGGVYGETDDAESIRTIHTAIERGATFLDTGDFYGMGKSEMVIGRAIRDRRDKVELSVKFGALRGPDGSWIGYDARPVMVKTWVAYSLKRLGVDVIDVYRPSRLDPNVPIEETIGAIADLIKAGYVRKIGLSEVGPETIRRAHAVHPITDLQIEYSVASRSAEAKIFPTLHELGIGATLYGVYSRGLLTGSKPKPGQDFRAHLPRFTSDARATNDAVVAKLHGFAKQKNMTPAQLLVAWVIAKEPKFMPLIGVKTQAQLLDGLGALEKPLSKADLAALEEIAPASAFAGDRYAPQAMKVLDSER